MPCVWQMVYKGRTLALSQEKEPQKERTERSAIDLVYVSEDLVEEIFKPEVDEKKEYALESIMKTKQGIKVSKSDHNTIISQFKLKRNAHTDKERVEVFNFKDKVALEKFKELTSEKGEGREKMIDKSESLWEDAGERMRVKNPSHPISLDAGERMRVKILSHPTSLDASRSDQGFKNHLA